MSGPGSWSIRRLHLGDWLVLQSFEGVTETGGLASKVTHSHSYGEDCRVGLSIGLLNTAAGFSKVSDPQNKDRR